MSTLNGKAYIGKITKQSEGDKTLFFVNLSMPHGGKDDKKQYQYLSCFVSKSLNRLFTSAYESQTEEPDGKFVNTLSASIADVEIVDSFFSLDENDGKTYLNGTGILSSVSFA